MELSKLGPEEIQRETQIMKADEENYRTLMMEWELLPSQEDCSRPSGDRNYPERRRLRLRARPWERTVPPFRILHKPLLLQQYYSPLLLLEEIIELQ